MIKLVLCIVAIVLALAGAFGLSALGLEPIAWLALSIILVAVAVAITS